MARSGSFQNMPTSTFGLYCTWSAAQSVTGNYSDVTLNVYIKYWSLDVGSRSDSTISINGVSETYTAPYIEDYSGGSNTRLIKSKTVRVYHNQDGTKTGVPLSASWRFDGTYSGSYIGRITAQTTISLDSIDRTPPIVSIKTSSITANSFYLQASTSASANTYQYSLDGGKSWKTLSSGTGTSASIIVNGLSPNTNYQVRVRAKKISNGVFGYSVVQSVKTLGGSKIKSLKKLIADADIVKIEYETTVYEPSYTHKLYLTRAGKSIISFTNLRFSKGISTHVLTLSEEQKTKLLNAMIDVKSFNGNLELASFNGSTQIGSRSISGVSVLTTEKSYPGMEAFTFRDSNRLTVAVTEDESFLIQDYSVLSVTPGLASAKNGAHIVHYSVSCDGYTKSSDELTELVIGIPREKGERQIVVTATDSRGHQVSRTENCTVIPYEKPKAREITLRRTNDIEAEVQLILSGTIAPIKVKEVQKNRLKYLGIRTKSTSEEDYSSWIYVASAITRTGSNFSYKNLEQLHLNPDSSFDVQIVLGDLLSPETNVYYNFSIPQGRPLLALRKQKVGINVANPTSALHVKGNCLVEGKISGKIDGTSIVSPVPIESGGTGADNKWEALKNLGALPVIGGDLKGQLRYSGAPSSWVNGRSNSPVRTVTSTNPDSFYPIVSVKSINGSWEIGALADYLAFSYVTDADNKKGINRSKHIYLDTNGKFIGSTQETACDQLYSGVLKSGSVSFVFGAYAAYLVIGHLGSGSYYTSLMIPKHILGTSNTTFIMSDESYYLSFNMRYSGSSAVLSYQSSNNSCYVSRVYGFY